MLLKTYVMLTFSLMNYWNIVFALPVTPPEQYKETRFELESCMTPSQEKGWCLPINMCLHLYKVVVTKPISQSNFQLLVDSKCGFMATVPKVCCKDYPHPYPGYGVPPKETTISPNSSTVPTKPTTTPTLQASQPQVSANDLDERVNQKPTINLLATVDECQVESTDKVYRGEVPDAVQFGFMALLEFTNDFGKRARCSGVLINNRHVLTSARCVTIPGNWTLNHVRLGEYNTATEPDCFEYSPIEKECWEALVVAVEKVIVHEQYTKDDPNQYHDIALVKLAKEVKYTPFIRPICIATSQQELKDLELHGGERYQMIGWNSTNNNNLVKRMKLVTVRDNAECETKYKKQMDKNQLCGQSTKSNYPKDLKSSVLAAVLNKGGEVGWYLGGLSTFPANPENGALRIYTKPVNYVDWIIDKVQQSLR